MFLPEKNDEKQQAPRTPGRGPEAFLSKDEETFLARMLSYPESFPPKFKSWLTEYLAVNMQPIPSSLVQGGGATTVTQAQVLTSESTASTSYVNLATTGPTVTGLSDGNYLLLFGAQYDSPAAGAGYMSPSINGSTPSDNDGAIEDPRAANRFNISRAVTKTLANNNNNTVTMQYRSVSGTNSWAYRWLVVLKTGN